MPHYQDSTSSSWPLLSTIYQDEYGSIDPDVYAAAGKLWPKVQSQLYRDQFPSDAGRTLMLRAAALVTRTLGSRIEQIENLHGYLWVAFRRLLVDEIERNILHSKLDAEYVKGLTSATPNSEDEIEKLILIDQIRNLADNWLREVIELLLLGHTFEEIADFHGKKANAIRSKFHKKVKKLRKTLNHQ